MGGSCPIQEIIPTLALNRYDLQGARLDSAAASHMTSLCLLGIRKEGLCHPPGHDHTQGPLRFLLKHVTCSHSDTLTPAPQISSTLPVRCSESDLRKKREAEADRPHGHRGLVLLLAVLGVN